jgi:periplasmic protein TonB
MQMKFTLFGALLGLLLAAPNLSYAQEDSIQIWRKTLAEHVASRRFYPLGANGEPGSARVLFVMDRSGNLISSALVESTGSQVLDAAALAIVERAAPFPKPPPEAAENMLRAIVPVVFQGRRLRPPPDPKLLDAWLERQAKESEKTPWSDKDDASVNAKLRSICRGC